MIILTTKARDSPGEKYQVRAGIIFGRQAFMAFSPLAVGNITTP